MTICDRIEAALRLQPVDRIPFTCYEGVVPAGALDIIPDLGIVRPCGPYGTSTPNVQWSSEQIDDETMVQTIETPIGKLTQRSVKESGYGSWWITEYYVKTPEDYGVLEYWMNDHVLTPNPDIQKSQADDVGDRGVIMGSLPRAPLQKLWIEYAGIERMSLDLFDCRDKVLSVLEAMGRINREAAEINAESPAEFVWLPDNMTGEVAGPALFGEILAPYYAEMCEILHAKGKRLVCHMDGMMKRLVDTVAETDIDIIEAFTPPPDADLPLDEARAAWQGKAIWINFPSSVHLNPPERVKEVTRELVAQAGDEPGFLVSITENIPLDIGTRSLEAIGEVLRGE
ncbi:MAG TPA: uroporphyrinogen decarboxylase family protein [Armatimonadota bacterium]|nr:uroporphyrinogen decarboxylase family protein [Armatimonadota bacterium]